MYRLVDRFDARRLQEICDVLDLLLALSRIVYPHRLQFQGEHVFRGGYENNESDNIAPARKRAEFMVICGQTRQRTQMKLHRIVQPRRSEERRGGKEGVSTCRSRGWADN